MRGNKPNACVRAGAKESGKNCLMQKRLFAKNRHLLEFRYELMFYLTGESISFSMKGRAMDEHDSVHNGRFLTQPAFAGFPSPADDDAEKRLDLTDLIVAHPVSTYFMRVSGHSMRNACIYDRDIVAVDRALTAAHNRIIVARLGDGFTLKRLQLIQGGRRIFLKSEHPSYSAVEVTGRGDFEIFGIVTWVMHRLAGPRAER